MNVASSWRFPKLLQDGDRGWACARGCRRRRRVDRSWVAAERLRPGGPDGAVRAAIPRELRPLGVRLDAVDRQALVADEVPMMPWAQPTVEDRATSQPPHEARDLLVTALRIVVDSVVGHVRLLLLLLRGGGWTSSGAAPRTSAPPRPVHRVRDAVYPADLVAVVRRDRHFLDAIPFFTNWMMICVSKCQLYVSGPAGCCASPPASKRGSRCETR
jgi:hypothetical protein